MNLFLAPHCDDETLFGAYTLLAHRPRVIVCFDGAPRHGEPAVRRAEFEAAMGVLGCDHEFLSGDLERLAVYDPARVWAPYPESDGNVEHNLVAAYAHEFWADRVSYYTTYTTSGRTTVGDRVQPEPGWETLKRLALACYRSQIRHPGTAAHFYRPLDEYLVAA